MNSNLNYNYLLTEYRSLWKNRMLTGDIDAKEILKDAIARELKDENAHPRVRKSKHEKYYLATKRIIESTISEGNKQLLLKLHIEQMERMN